MERLAAEEEMMPSMSDYRATIYSDGTVQYYYPTVLKSVCRVDVTYFPFDTQVCSLQFGSWSHHGLELDVVNTGDSADISTFITHNEWDVVEVPAVRNEIYYQCCKEPYPDVTFKITIKRKPRFYVLTILFPCILTGSIAALGFLLPTESGEKVSLEITVLLSLAVFLLIVSESLPASSENFPYIGMYFASLMSLVSLACMFTVLVLNVNFRGLSGKKIPKWANTIFINGCGWILLNKTGKYDMNHDPPQEMKVNGQINHEQNEDTPKETIVQNVSTKDLLLRSRDPLISLMRRTIIIFK
ncbi:hypothetical protein KUTeg_017758 [Tegillarca granosa]|uniref:Uncharacterized protein n=1 Tax=Tegillarca granosa TaxID=220873 RepID=A0ABQ9EG48_TEGGR|nr:hypothetical protein KUTeg_017758 [Tegillarca granosa]